MSSNVVLPDEIISKIFTYISHPSHKIIHIMNLQIKLINTYKDNDLLHINLHMLLSMFCKDNDLNSTEFSEYYIQIIGSLLKKKINTKEILEKRREIWFEMGKFA
jgi:hypothetical protein